MTGLCTGLWSRGTDRGRAAGRALKIEEELELAVILEERHWRGLQTKRVFDATPRLILRVLRLGEVGPPTRQ